MSQSLDKAIENFTLEFNSFYITSFKDYLQNSETATQIQFAIQEDNEASIPLSIIQEFLNEILLEKLYEAPFPLDLYRRKWQILSQAYQKAADKLEKKSKNPPIAKFIVNEILSNLSSYNESNKKCLSDMRWFRGKKSHMLLYGKDRFSLRIKNHGKFDWIVTQEKWRRYILLKALGPFDGNGFNPDEGVHACLIGDFNPINVSKHCSALSERSEKDEALTNRETHQREGWITCS